MSNHLARQAAPIAAKLAELSFAAPAVMAHRIGRMALAGAVPSARDQREFESMVSEKTAAFGASWNAMAAQAVRANQALAASWLRMSCTPALWGDVGIRALQNQAVGAAIGVLGKGLAPVHGTVVANARRLGRVAQR